MQIRNETQDHSPQWLICRFLELNPTMTVQKDFQMPIGIAYGNKGSRKKKRIFYGQADRKGGGHHPRPDRSICENFRF